MSSDKEPPILIRGQVEVEPKTVRLWNGVGKKLGLQSCSQSLVVQKAVVGEELRLEAGEEQNRERH
jgi:hypothetical protein